MQAVTRLDQYVFEFPGFLAAEQCRALVEKGELMSFEAATINDASAPERIEEVRNNDRLIVDDEVFAEDLWKGIRPFVPSPFSSREAIGLNERLRYYRYGPGQLFDWHKDGSYDRPTGERSLFTFMIYLNDDFEGGTTSFCDWRSPLLFDDFEVAPETGKALLFFHPITHRGNPLIRGQKYVLRTDVMYSARQEAQAQTFGRWL